MVVQFVYTKLAKKLTRWENHKTVSSYQEALVLKLFTFNFINSYGSLFYLSYFRNVIKIILKADLNFNIIKMKIKR